MSEKRKYDSTVARMAGNIAAGLCSKQELAFYALPSPITIARLSVEIARAISAETARTEPEVPSLEKPADAERERIVKYLWVYL